MCILLDPTTIDRRADFWRRRNKYRAEAYEQVGRLLRQFGPAGRYPDRVSLLEALDESIRRLGTAGYLGLTDDMQYAKGCWAAERILRRVRWAAGRCA